MKTYVARGAVLAALALIAIALLVGGVDSDPAPEGGDSVAAATTAAPETAADPYPLAAGTTSEEIQLVVYERAYSECASTDLDLLAAKYKAADDSKQGVATVVGRAWASYFSAGQDAVQDGRDACLLGQRHRNS